MKQGRLGLLLFALALLINCTILSCFIEEQMTVPVSTVRGRNAERNAGGCALPPGAVQEDGDGYFVFAVKEQNGMRKAVVAERQGIVLLEAGEGLAVTNADVGQDYIRYAARTVAEGARLRPVKGAETVPDTCLVFPEDGGSPQIIEMPEAPAPFMEGQARESLEKQGVQAGRIYSLSEAAVLYASCPKLALAVVLCLAPFFLLPPTCLSLRLGDTGRKLLALNGLICMGVWSALAVTLRGVRLPASLLPGANILDFSHYHALLKDIHAALGGPDEEYAGLSVAILAVGVAVLALAAAGEVLLLKKNTRRGRHWKKHRRFALPGHARHH